MLSPASLPKRGSRFDIALAVEVLAADGIVPTAALAGVLLLRELGLDGSVRGVAGVQPAVLAGARHGFHTVIVPAANLAEAQLLPGTTAHGVASLRDLVALLRGQPYPAPDEPPGDFVEVVGQPVGRTACEVAAAGGHNLLMTGPPGCGKTLLAERVPGILPPPSLEESLEVTAIHSVAEQLPLVSRPPFQAPHHGATPAAIVGGGSGIAKPGAASLAHRSVCGASARSGRTAVIFCPTGRGLQGSRRHPAGRTGQPLPDFRRRDPPSSGCGSGRSPRPLRFGGCIQDGPTRTGPYSWTQTRSGISTMGVRASS